jgi:hypothetical protein
MEYSERPVVIGPWYENIPKKLGPLIPGDRNIPKGHCL